MKLEDQIRALLEANKEQEADEKADRVDDEPAVKIENPMDPDLISSETPEGEIAAADAQGQEEDGEQKPIKEDAMAEFETAKAKAMATEPNGDNQEAQFAATQAVQNQTVVDQSDADAMARFEAEKAEAEKMREVAVEESISDLLGDEFSAEFKTKAQAIFEAAVKDSVIKFKQKLQEEHDAAVAALQEKFEESMVAERARLQEETSDKIDGYLSYIAEEWKKDNAVALEQAIKTELTESFIGAMKSVFESHYIDLPEDKVDLYKQVCEEKADLENALSTSVGKLSKLTEEVNAFKREQIIEESLKDFSSLDAARFKTLTEDFVFEDADTFKIKVDTIKKSFFGKKSASATKEQLAEELSTEAIVESTETPVETMVEDVAMSAYVRALGKK